MEPTIEPIPNTIETEPRRSLGWKFVDLPKQAFPNEDEELLLQAALSDGSSAMRAWEDWNRGNNLDAIDVRSFQILPLVYKNLASQGLADSTLERLKGVYRQAWYKNTLRLREVKQIVHKLRSIGIESMVLKDAGLALFYYDDLACCPIRTIDITVHKNMAQNAMALLNSIGWQSQLTQYANIVSYREWLAFQNSSGTPLILHWGSSFESTSSRETHEVILPASSTQDVDIPIRVMTPTKQLFYTLIEGPKRKGDRGVRWVADTVTIIKKSGNLLDWNGVVDTALALEQVVSVKNCCWYLHAQFGLPIPEEQINRLRNAPTSKFQHIEWHVKTRAQTGARSVLRRVANHIIRYSRLRKHDTLFNKIRHYPKFLQYQWELGTISSVPIYCVKRGFQVFFQSR